MKVITKKLILIGLLLQANFISAEIYFHQDKNGTVSFSDKPSVNAKLVKPTVQVYRYKHHVDHVYDGDTIVLKNGERVRLLGINTPEIESRHRRGDVGGELAKKWLHNQLENTEVFLEYDQEKRDKYDRLLAHLFLPTGEHINEMIVQSGLATLTIIPPNLRHSKKLIEAEQQAQQQGLGIWSMPEYQAIPITELSKGTVSSGWHRFLATPSKITESRKYVRLILSDKVDVRIPKDNLNLFPDLMTYVEKKLEFRGWASRSKAHFSILIRHPSAMVFL